MLPVPFQQTRTFDAGGIKRVMITDAGDDDGEDDRIFE
jgi:hypothetical protein